MAQPNYSWNAVDYAKNSANQYAWAQELIPKLKLSGNETLLDIGCGDGKITAELARYLPNGRVLGIDSSKQMINLARKTFPNAKFPNLSFKVMDARKLTFQAEFDRAFSNAALHWIVNQNAVLSGIQKSLKSGGRLLFQMAGKGNAKDVLSIIDELAVAEPWKSYLSGMAFPYGFYDPEEYNAFLKQAGLVPLRAELFPKDMQFKGKEGLAGWIRTTWLPFTDRLPIDIKPKLVDLIVNRYLERHPADAAGVVHVGMMRLEVEAYKP
ncbi:MAG: methyltransferase domain-containing protein [Candidatus Bathyarchaeota archaeon]|nr:methyltransferase domain-containing protein [Candidatus Bathyarchaeota archaeon]